MNSKSLPKLAPILLLLVAAPFLLVGYDSELPFIDIDEATVLTQTIHDRNLGTYDVVAVPGYPPLVPGLLHGTQRITEFITGTSVLEHTSLVIRIVRLLGAGANLVTVYLIYRIGTKLQSPLVGYAAALVWVALPSVHQQVQLALTESRQLLFITASIWMMLKTLETRRWTWAMGCTVVGLLAVAAKYSAFPALGLGVGVTLWLAWTDRRTWLWTTLLQFVLIALAAYLLLGVYGATSLVERGRPEVIQFMQTGLDLLLDSTRVLYLFNVAAMQIGLHALPILVVVVLIGAVLFVRSACRDERFAWGVLLAFSISYIWFVSSFLVFDELKERYVSPSSSALVLLTALSIYGISRFISQRFRIRRAVLFGLLWGVWILPPLTVRSLQMLASTYPYTDRAFVEWSSASLEPGKMALLGYEGKHLYWRYFNPIWGDYHGPQREVADILLFLQKPKPIWEESGIDFVLLTGNYPGDYPPLPFDREEMLFLKGFPPRDASQPWRGDTFYVYRLKPIQHPLAIRFADTINLAGYDLKSNRVEQGEDLAVRLYWRSDAVPDADYQLYLHLTPLDAHAVLAQADGTPALPNRPTTTWSDPYETLIGPEYRVPIPEDLPPGQYRLLAGLYNLETGERLLIAEGTDFVMLNLITVCAADHEPPGQVELTRC